MNDESRPKAAPEAVTATTTASIRQNDDDHVAAVRRLAREHRRLYRRPCKHLSTVVPCRRCRRERISVQDEMRELVRETARTLHEVGYSVAQISRRLDAAPRLTAYDQFVGQQVELVAGGTVEVGDALAETLRRAGT